MGGLGSIPGLGRSPGEGKGYPFTGVDWRIPWANFTHFTSLHGSLPSPSIRIKSSAVAADLNAPWKGFQGGEQKRGTLCWGKSWQTHLQLVRYSPEPIILAQLLCLHISRIALKSLSDDCFLWLVKSFIHQTSRKVQGKVYAWVHVLPLHQNHIYTHFLPHYLFAAVSHELSEVLSPRL